MSTSCFYAFLSGDSICPFEMLIQTSENKHRLLLQNVAAKTEKGKLSTIQTPIKDRQGAGVYPSMHQVMHPG